MSRSFFHRLGLQMCLVVVAVAAGAVAPSAQATIVPSRGIAGVRLGYSMKRVRHALGKPRRVAPPAWEYGRPLRGRVSFNHRRRVDDIWTVSPRQRTRRGIGPGASLRRFRLSYPRVHCRGRHRRRVCIVAAHHNGRTTKTFFAFRGRLRMVEIYLLPPRGGSPVHK